MTSVLVISLAMVVVASLVVLTRLVLGPTIVDRVLALDTLLVMLVIGLAIHASLTGSDHNLDVLVVVALLGFVGTTLLARLIERRGP